MTRHTAPLALGCVALASLLVPVQAQDDPMTSVEFDEPPVLSRFEPAHESDGKRGPSMIEPEGTVRLYEHVLEADGHNVAAAFRCTPPRGRPAARWAASFDVDIKVGTVGEGVGFAFLDVEEYGRRGPAPFVRDWTEPNLRGTFAVALDVSNPKNDEPFSALGNYQGLPEREVSLHFDGRELVKRVSPVEFRRSKRAEDAGPARLDIEVEHVCGGAEVTVRIDGTPVYDRHFVADLHPYEFRPAFGAIADGTTGGTVGPSECNVRLRDLRTGKPAPRLRRPIHVEVFHHVMTDNQKQHFEKTVTLPPADWEIGRVILTLDIHDGGELWDEWDRNGEISIFVPDPDGEPGADGKPAERKLGIVPFITSYRTPCHWKVDVTHFRPWLHGKVRFEVRAGTNFYKGRGYLMSVALDFHHGKPELVPHRITPLWVGTAKHGAMKNHFQDFFTDRSVTIDPSTTAARVFSTTTGHSQIGEFTPSKRVIHFDGDASAEGGETSFENVLWKTDVYLNPNRPQFGTWKYSRAGWAPGDIVHPWWIDLTPHMTPGKTATLRYQPFPYAKEHLRPETTPKQIGQASHVVRSYLIEYRPADGLVPAPSLRVTNVAGGSNAAKLGVKRGDYLVRYGDTRLDTIEDLRKAATAAQEAGVETTPVEVLRGSKTLTFDFPPGKLGVGLAQE